MQGPDFIYNGRVNVISPACIRWTDSYKAAFDLETTGSDPLTALAVTASIIIANGAGKIVKTYEWLINPGSPIPPQATRIHGITTEKARAEGAKPTVALRQINCILSEIWSYGYPVAAYNACYDFTVLAAEGLRRGVDVVTPRFVLDPYILDKKMDNYRKGKRTLEATCRHYGVALDDAHTSAADSLATVKLAHALIKTYPELNMPLTQLYATQKKWAVEQARSLQEYFAGQGRQEEVNGQWPVRSLA